MPPRRPYLSSRMACGLLFIVLLFNTASGHIRLPVELVNHVGEEINFKIPTDGEPATFGANHLPLGLVVDANTGIVSGTLREAGTYEVRFYQAWKNADVVHSAYAQWHIREEDELSERQVFTRLYEVEAGEDLSGRTGVLNDYYEVTKTGTFPDGASYDAEFNRLNGSIDAVGIYEVEMEQTAGPMTLYTTIVFVVKPVGNVTLLSLPLSGFRSGMTYYKGTYFWPGSEGILTNTDLSGDWQPANFQLQGFLYDLEIFKDMLIAAADGGVWISEDGVDFEFIAVPEIQNVERVIPGPEGVFIECNAFNQARLYYSSDGRNWTFVEYPAQTIASLSPERLNRLVSVEDEFYTTEHPDFLVSSDGSNWTRKATEGLDARLPDTGIQYGNGKLAFIQDGGVYFGTSLTDWTFTPLPPGSKWDALLFQGDRFFAIGTDAEIKNAGDDIYSSKHGEAFIPVDPGDNISIVHSLAMIEDTLFVEESSWGGNSRGVLVTNEEAIPSAYFPDEIPFAAGEPLFLPPLQTAGNVTSIKAYGLPLGVEFDEARGVISGAPRERISGTKDVFFVPESNGIPGLVSRSEYKIGGGPGDFPHINIDQIEGVVGERLEEGLLMYPYFGPNDSSSRITLSGHPSWLWFDKQRSQLVGTPTQPILSSFTIHGENLYGETSKEIPLIVGSTVYNRLPYISNSNYSTDFFTDAGGLVFSNSGDGLAWSEDMKTWKGTTPRIRSKNGVVYFKDRFYIYDQPGIYASDDGENWTPDPIRGVDFFEDQSLFATDDHMYMVANHQLLATTDGENWEPVGDNLPADNLVKHVGDYFFAYNRAVSTILHRSVDAINWERATGTSGGLPIADIVYGNGIYVAGTANGFTISDYILRSTDGLNWTKVTLPIHEPMDLRPITFGNGKFHLVTDEASYMSSSDGWTWDGATYPESSQGLNIDFVDFVRGRVLAGGDRGRLFELGDIPPTVEMPYSDSFKVGEYIYVPIESMGNITEFTVLGLPPGLNSLKKHGGIYGTPAEPGIYRVTVIAHSETSFSQPANYWVIIYEGDPQISLKDSPYFQYEHVHINYPVHVPEDYSEAWYLDSPNLPPGLTITGLDIDGRLDNGVYSFTLNLMSETGALIESKPVTLYVSKETYQNSGYQVPELYAEQGVPMSESFLFTNPDIVSGLTGLPEGLSFNSSTKLLSGTPTEAGKYVLEASFLSWPEKWYVELVVGENFGILSTVQGNFNSDTQAFEFEFSPGDSSGVSFQWFQGDVPLTDGNGISGTTSSKLSVEDISMLDLQQLRLRLVKNQIEKFVKASFPLSEAEYHGWASSLGLSGEEADPSYDGLDIGYPNLFAFLQEAESAEDIIHPEPFREGDFAGIRFTSTRIWDQDNLSVFAVMDIRDARHQLVPKIVAEENGMFVWEAMFYAPGRSTSFFELQVKLPN